MFKVLFSLSLHNYVGSHTYPKIGWEERNIGTAVFFAGFNTYAVD